MKTTVSLIVVHWNTPWAAPVNSWQFIHKSHLLSSDCGRQLADKSWQACKSSIRKWYLSKTKNEALLMPVIRELSGQQRLLLFLNPTSCLPLSICRNLQSMQNELARCDIAGARKKITQTKYSFPPEYLEPSHWNFRHSDACNADGISSDADWRMSIDQTKSFGRL